jgi:hypothetical protein
MQLSYVRYALKTASDPRGMLEMESAVLGLSNRIRSLLQQYLPTKAVNPTHPWPKKALAQFRTVEVAPFKEG